MYNIINLHIIFLVQLVFLIFAILCDWREVEAGLMEYKPDIIISVHPLMQHIPLWVLKWQGLQKKVVFVTVITDLNSCHPTWLVNKPFWNYIYICYPLIIVHFALHSNFETSSRFHPGVNRCYCPSEEVAKRALLDGLEESQTRVFGLPIRPSFARAVLSKVGVCLYGIITVCMFYWLEFLIFTFFVLCLV